MTHAEPSGLSARRPALAAQAALLMVMVLARACAAATAQDYRDPNFDYFVAGDPAAPRAGQTHLLLALMGGGGSVDSAFRALAAAAGHGHLVILRAVSDDSFDPEDRSYGDSFRSKWGPVASAQTLTFHNRKASADPRVLAILAGADGIFIAGGDQANYLHYWKGTPVERALNEHVRAHRPIGGSSAGLAILGHFSYTALDGGSLESKTALPDPFNPGVTLESDFLHLPFLGEVITDSHFSQRCRLGRLIVFVARLNAARGTLRTLGLGIDERTVLLIDEHGSGRLAAGSAGSAWAVRATGPATRLAPGAPLTLAGVRVTRLDAGSRIDLPQGRVARPGAQSTARIRAGVADPDALLSPRMLRLVVPPDEP